MTSPPGNKLAAFEEKVKRTVYIEILAPQVTSSVLEKALDQFGTVKNVQLIPTYSEAKNCCQCVLVEMEKRKEAIAVVSTLTEFPFMINGTPRPVRALHARPEMFEDRPRPADRRINCFWLDPRDPDFKTAKAMKNLTLKHVAESSYLLRDQFKRQEKLAKLQADSFKANSKKYELIDGISNDRTAENLARYYGMQLPNDY